MKNKILAQLPKVLSLSNTLVLQLKNEQTPICEIEEKVSSVIFQHLVEEKASEILRISGFICPNYKVDFGYNVSLVDTAILGLAQSLIEESLKFSKITPSASLSIDLLNIYNIIILAPAKLRNNLKEKWD